jgi:hypothetical protein
MRLKSCPSCHPFSLAQMRPVDHLSVKRQDSRLGACCRKQRQDADRTLNIFRRRGESPVDHRNLIGMDRHLAGKAIADRGAALGIKTVHVAEIGKHGIDGIDAGIGGCQDRQGSGHAEHIGVGTAFILVGRGADVRGQILRAPGQRRKPL